MYGGDGNDTLVSNSYQDAASDVVLDGGAGIDPLVIDRFYSTGILSLDLSNPSQEQSFGGTRIIGIDRVSYRGGSGSDLITGGDLDDTIDGNGGDDVLNGGDGSDTVYAGDGSDRIYGGDGDDRLYTFGNSIGVTDQLIDGGAGTDFGFIYLSSTGPATLSIADPETDQIVNGTIIRGIERLEFHGSGAGSFAITGGNLNDVIYGSVGDDTLDGGDGDDYLYGSQGANSLYGGSGNDILNSQSSEDTTADYYIDGGSGVDTLRLSRYSRSYDLMLNVNDPESMTVFDGTSIRGVENFQVDGGKGNDQFLGGQYSDSLRGFGGDDILDGGEGDDTLDGGSGANIVHGGSGNDTITIDYRDNVAGSEVDGGAGIDRLNISVFNAYLFGETSLTVSFADPSVDQNILGTRVRGIEQVNFIGGFGNENVTGGSLSDNLQGNDGDDVLMGSGGDDELDGGEGVDTLLGGDGNDIISAYDATADLVLDGGAGTDTINLALYMAASTIHFSVENPETEQLVRSTRITGFERANVVGGQYNDVFTGGQYEDIFYGSDGDDIWRGNGGDDLLIGEAGFDTVILSGSKTDYKFVSTLNDPNYFTIYDLRSGKPDGTDVVGEVESIQFYDGTFSVVDVLSPALNIAPSELNFTGGSVDENSSAGTVIGAFNAQDADGDVLSYFLTDDADGRFVLNSATGVLTIAEGVSLDFEGTHSFEIQALAKDATGDIISLRNSIYLQNVIEDQSRILSLGADIFSAVSDDNWTVDGRAGADKITTLAGADTIRGGTGNDVISTGAGDDVIKVGAGEGYDAIDGGVGLDRIEVLANGTIIGLSSLANIESITASGFSGVSISGSTAADTLDFTSTDLVGITRIDGGAGNDVIKGSAGADRIYGGAGVDTVNGGGGDDVIEYGTTADIIDGGTGFDTLELRTDNISISWASIKNIEVVDAKGFSGVKIAGSTASETLDFSSITLNGVSSVDGGSGNDIIKGSTGSDTIYGGTGNDTLTGGGGIDALLGGDGNDKITGGAGADVLTGGVGTDNFIFTATSESGRGTFDRVTDFLQGTDKIDLSAIDANFTTLGNGAFSFIGGNAFSKTRGELRLDTSAAGHTSVYGDTDGNGIADLEIRVDWHGLPAIQLMANDFVL